MTAVKENSVIEKRYLTQFKDLLIKLSPENLTCDGELSTSESGRKLKKLLKDWKRLEKKVGRFVGEDEIEALIYPTNELVEALATAMMRGD
jgi:hypothetical protein